MSDDKSHSPRGVPLGDVAAIAVALLAAACDREERGRMEARAIERARTFTWDAAADATESVLVEAIEAR